MEHLAKIFPSVVSDGRKLLLDWIAKGEQVKSDLERLVRIFYLGSEAK